MRDMVKGFCAFLILSAALCACKAPESISFWTPRPAFLQGLPTDDSSYSQGVRDGCTQAVGIGGEGLTRIYGFAYDVNRGIEDREYYRGYVIGQNHCTYFNNVEPL